MGAWDADPFGNDDAADWAAEFELLDRTAGLQVLDAVFAAANQADYVEAPDGSIAVAAAQVGSSFPTWSERHRTAPLLSPGPSDVADSPIMRWLTRLAEHSSECSQMNPS